jgi:hypothetical protein
MKFWIVKPYNSARDRLFGGGSRLHLQGRTVSQSKEKKICRILQISCLAYFFFYSDDKDNMFLRNDTLSPL